MSLSTISVPSTRKVNTLVLSDDITLAPININPYKTYQAKISQSGTSAPTATVYLNELGATITFGRTSAGLYTITAGSAVFTSTKTHIFMEPPIADLVTFKPVKTSTTVITLTTGLSAVIATVLTAVPTDVLLTNTLIEIRVYN